MEIKLDGYELEEAVLEFIKNKYGVTVELSEPTLCDYDELTFYVKEINNNE